MTQSIQNALLTTVSGKFYVGMTAEEAKKKDLYKSIFSRDFTDIDKNGNGVLEDSEICDERDLECKRKDAQGGAIAVAGQAASGALMLATPVTAGGATALGLGVAAFSGTVGGSMMRDAIDERKITKQYRQEHGI